MRTFRSGPYLERLFQQAERMDERAKQAITARIKQAREEAGYTQEEIADLLGVRLRTYQNYESQANPRPPFRLLREISDITGKPQEWFLRGDASRGLPASDAAEILDRLDEIRRRLDRLEERAELRGQQAS